MRGCTDVWLRHEVRGREAALTRGCIDVWLRREAATRGCDERLRREAATRGCDEGLRREAATRGCDEGLRREAATRVMRRAQHVWTPLCSILSWAILTSDLRISYPSARTRRAMAKQNTNSNETPKEDSGLGRRTCPKGFAAKQT